MQNVESLFLEVSRAIDDSNLAEAKELLQHLLEIDPGYGRAHNHLGWIYETKIKDFEMAKRHYELAIKFCEKTYPNVYVNYAYLLIDYGQLDKANEIIEEAMEIPGSDSATLIYQKGKIAEHHQKFITANRYYRTARRISFNKDFIIMINQEISRLNLKLNLWEKIILKSKLF